MIDLTSRNFEEAEQGRFGTIQFRQVRQINYVLRVSAGEFYTANISAQKHTDMTGHEISYSTLTVQAV